MPPTTESPHTPESCIDGNMAGGHDGMRIGIDLGGTKIEGIVLAADGSIAARERLQTPQGIYSEIIATLAQLIVTLETEVGAHGLPVGLGIPGSPSPTTGLIRNANSTCLNGSDLVGDLTCHLAKTTGTNARAIAIANDANCFALSEASDGAGEGCRTVIGIILGTGVGSGIVIDGCILNGPLGIGGEWGHNPLPETACIDGQPITPVRCWCGRMNCLEVHVSGPALERQYEQSTGVRRRATEIATQSEAGDNDSRIVIDMHCHKLAAALAGLVNIIDPDVIVLGGGLSAMPHLYRELPKRMAPLIFSDAPRIDIRPPKWGDASGVRGAAWLNPLPSP